MLSCKLAESHYELYSGDENWNRRGRKKDIPFNSSFMAFN